MKYAAYKLMFSTALHVGKGKLENSEYEIFADTIFSSLCHEALSRGGEPELKKLVDAVENDRLRISDAMPCCEGTPYLPKPMMSIDSAQESNSEIKKSLKKLKYIPAEKMDDYLKGKLDIKAESDKLKQMGKTEIRTMVSIMPGEDSKPFKVGTYRFGHYDESKDTYDDKWGIYIVIGYADDSVKEVTEDLLMGLGYTGIGGKRSSGLGKYELFPLQLPDSMMSRIITEKSDKGIYMSLSFALPEDEKIAEITEKAQYQILKRSGYVSSSTYADNFLKKKDFYGFKSGSIFEETFNGVIADVSSGGKHPVYKYAKPIFLEVGQK